MSAEVGGRPKSTGGGTTSAELLERYCLDGMLAEIDEAHAAARQGEPGEWLFGYKRIAAHINMTTEFVRKRLVFEEGCPIVRPGTGSTVRVFSTDLDNWLRQKRAP
ncbi:MAG: hypothetical protein AAGH60_02160 [Pseudomonadota bacterium]